MNIYISLLRGINLGNHYKIRMDDLCSLYKTLGLHPVKTYLQSGNVVFACPETPEDTAAPRQENDALPASLAKQIEGAIETVMGYSVEVFVRTPHDFQRILQQNPFLQKNQIDPSSLYVTFLDEPPDENQLSGLKTPNDDGDEFRLGQDEIFIACRNGYGRTKLNNNFFERKLKVPATTRNWKTVNELFRLANELSADQHHDLDTPGE